MSCFYCWQQKIHTPHAGSCSECTRQVCIRPPMRADGEYHADICVCGCGKLVCEQDVQTHAANSHQSLASNCFSMLTLMTGVPGLCSVLAQGNADLPSHLPNTSAHAATRFLNSTGPGAPALRSVTKQLFSPEFLPLGLQRTSAADGISEVVVRDEFFGESSRRERLGATVAYALGDAWRRVQNSPSARPFLDEFLEEAPPVLASLLDTFSKRAFWQDDRRGAQLLGQTEARELRKLAGRWWLVGLDAETGWLDRVLANNTPPSKSTALASWIVFGEETEHRPVAGGRMRTRGA